MDLETWRPPYMKLNSLSPYWGPSTMTQIYSQMASSSLHWNSSFSATKEKAHGLPYRATFCQAHPVSSASLPCFQHRKRYMHSRHDHFCFFLFMVTWWTHSFFWQEVLQVVKCWILLRQHMYTPTALQAFSQGRLSNPYLWHTEKWSKRQAHCPWTFHPCNTLPHPRSSTPGGSSQLTQGNPTPNIVLLLPYSKQDLLLSCIPRHHASTLFFSPTSPAFLCQPSVCGVPLTMFQWY